MIKSWHLEMGICRAGLHRTRWKKSMIRKTGYYSKKTKQRGTKKSHKNKNQVKTALSLSDKLNQENLLRFYVPNGFTTIDPAKYDYKNQVQRNPTKLKKKKVQLQQVSILKITIKQQPIDTLQRMDRRTNHRHG